jgi:protein-disulfide isomerase
MKMNHLLLGLAFGLVGLTASAQPQNSGSFSGDQVKQIQNVIHDYLVKNPQVLVEVSQALQAKQMKVMQSNTTKAIGNLKNAIFNDSTSPYAGNKDGNVIMVEFFDYQCGHCKDMKNVIEGLIKKNPNLKVIFKEFPIFGANSELASKWHSLLIYKENTLNSTMHY